MDFPGLGLIERRPRDAFRLLEPRATASRQKQFGTSAIRRRFRYKLAPAGPAESNTAGPPHRTRLKLDATANATRIVSAAD